MTRTVRLLIAFTIMAAGALVPAGSAQAVAYRSSACPSYACGSATATSWSVEGHHFFWSESVNDTSCGSGSPTAVVKIRILLSNNSSVYTTPRADTNCGDNKATAYSEGWVDTHLTVKGFWVRIDNGASTTPYTQGNWVDNPNT
jgi:hypothetical protein